MSKLIKVLIVDDSPIVRERLTEILLNDHCIRVVGEAAGIGDARRLVQSERPDVITLDLALEGGSGIELLREIKQTGRDPSGPSAPKVIVLTNHSSPAFREKCRQLGADAFFDKATQFESVKASVLELSNYDDHAR